MKAWGKVISFTAVGMLLLGTLGISCHRLVYSVENLNSYRLRLPVGPIPNGESPLERDRYLRRFAAAADNDERWYLTDEYLLRYPLSPFAISNQAYLLIDEGDCEEGIRLALDLLEFHGEQVSAYNNLSKAYNRLQQYQLSLYYVDKAVACNGGQATYRELIDYADAYQGLGQYDAAAERYLQVMEEFPIEAKKHALYCQQQLAMTYRSMGDNVGSLQLNLDILKVFPDNYSAFYEAAEIYKEMGDSAGLIELGEEYTANNPEEQYAGSLIGDMLLELRQYGQAAEFYIAYAMGDAYPVYGYYQAAKAYLLAGNRELARQYIELCLELEPDYLEYMEEPELWGWLDD